ncbi:mechanosensitive ion channel family protein [Sinomicrobium kalidii]|uniref:mechanosensitive ion channel family protein n=1 Tax=Sinomicrobium kalidii TaxID=2900738 RepID=UPI001E4DAC33|nr:mechanosensitive ion channel domain-containing protein [Sinomicrobium kalidii]UGU16810.1 mechanosensitive ion channel family protein [Sinomicrobium kalidii]
MKNPLKNLKQFVFPILTFVLSVVISLFKSTFYSMDAGIGQIAEKLAVILLITSFAWAAIIVTGIVKKLFLRHADITVENNLHSRKLYTQYNIIERIVVFIIILVAIALVLMSFENIRRIGISIFASAGVAGIILGLAAQKVFGSMLAGLQIAFTQPIRVDDVVVVEGEWGRIEEITLTYVVIRIWDLRRLVVPSTYFIEHPFQNWTRTSAEILGTVFIYTDYSVDFDRIREELTRLLERSRLWDGKVNVLQVTDAKENRVEVRALMSTRNSSDAWDLRVYVREQLLCFLQREFPDSLPKTRVFVENNKPGSVDAF